RREWARRKVTFASDAGVLWTRRNQPPAHLGGEHQRRVLACQRRAEPLLAQPESIKRRGVEVAHARHEGLVHGFERVFILQLAIQVSDASTAEAQRGDFNAGRSQLATRERRVHATAVSAGAVTSSRRDFKAKRNTTAKHSAGISMAVLMLLASDTSPITG